MKIVEYFYWLYATSDEPKKEEKSPMKHEIWNESARKGWQINVISFNHTPFTFIS